jgi:hypothetical protein
MMILMVMMMMTLLTIMMMTNDDGDGADDDDMNMVWIMKWVSNSNDDEEVVMIIKNRKVEPCGLGLAGETCHTSGSPLRQGFAGQASEVWRGVLAWPVRAEPFYGLYPHVFHFWGGKGWNGRITASECRAPLGAPTILEILMYRPP